MCGCSNYKAVSCIFYLFLSNKFHYLYIFYWIKSKFLCLAFTFWFEFNLTFPTLFPIILHQSPSRSKQVYSLLKRQHIPVQPPLVTPSSLLPLSTWLNPSYFQGPTQGPALVWVVITSHTRMYKKSLSLWSPKLGYVIFKTTHLGLNINSLILIFF